jgi:hypothetical protein
MLSSQRIRRLGTDPGKWPHANLSHSISHKQIICITGYEAGRVLEILDLINMIISTEKCTPIFQFIASLFFFYRSF